jgi:hypothetical protein
MIFPASNARTLRCGSAEDFQNMIRQPVACFFPTQAIEPQGLVPKTDVQWAVSLFSCTY